MDKQTLKIAGTLILLAGIVAGSIGGYRIAANLPVSDEMTPTREEGVVFPSERTAAAQRSESLRGDVEIQVRKSAIQSANKERKEKRSEGSVWLVSGIIALIWGVTILYYSRSTPEPS